MRSEVRKRDGHQCKWPGCAHKRYLEVHHIRKWSNNPGLRYATANCITLCKKHHKQVRHKEDLYIYFFLKILEEDMLKRLHRYNDKDK